MHCGRGPICAAAQDFLWLPHGCVTSFLLSQEFTGCRLSWGFCSRRDTESSEVLILDELLQKGYGLGSGQGWKQRPSIYDEPSKRHTYLLGGHIFLPMCLYLPMCLFAYLPIYLCACLPICLFAYLPICLLFAYLLKLVASILTPTSTGTCKGRNGIPSFRFHFSLWQVFWRRQAGIGIDEQPSKGTSFA